MYWKLVSGFTEDAMKELFTSGMGYSYPAFRQARLMCEEYADDYKFEKHCENVAKQVKLYPEFCALLKWLSQAEHTSAIIVTAGLRRVWETVLDLAGLPPTIAVIGNGRFGDKFVVTPQGKAIWLRVFKRSIRSTCGPSEIVRWMNTC